MTPDPAKDERERERPVTREDFFRDLRKAARRRETEDQAKRSKKPGREGHPR